MERNNTIIFHKLDKIENIKNMKLIKNYSSKTNIEIFLSLNLRIKYIKMNFVFDEFENNINMHIMRIYTFMIIYLIQFRIKRIIIILYGLYVCIYDCFIYLKKFIINRTLVKFFNNLNFIFYLYLNFRYIN